VADSPHRKAAKPLTTLGDEEPIKLAALALGLLVPLVATAAAQAAEPVPFTITEEGNFVTGVFTFTATGPLCPSGTYADDVTVAAPGEETQGAEGKLNLLIRARRVQKPGRHAAAS
jgi:hypothetical protein